MTGDVVQA